METFFLLLFSYLLGSIPSGFILGRLYGVDVRRGGSGNVGATNVARVVGKKQGLLTLIADVAKGFIPTLLSVTLGFSPVVTAVVALAAFLGHLYPVFLKFRGGKGVATTLGIFLALAPLGTACLVALFLLVALLSRVVSLASMVTAGAAPMVFYFLSYPLPVVALGSILALFIIMRHRENIQRLLAGAEPKFSL